MYKVKLEDSPLRVYVSLPPYHVYSYLVCVCVCVLPGSGSLAAMAVFEDRYVPNLEVRLPHLIDPVHSCVHFYVCDVILPYLSMLPW